MFPDRACRDLVMEASRWRPHAVLPVFLTIDDSLGLVLDASGKDVLASRVLADPGRANLLRSALGLDVGDRQRSEFGPFLLETKSFNRTSANDALRLECAARWLQADIDEGILLWERTAAWIDAIGDAATSLWNPLVDGPERLSMSGPTTDEHWVLIAEAALALESDLDTKSLSTTTKAKSSLRRMLQHAIPWTTELTELQTLLRNLEARVSALPVSTAVGPSNPRRSTQKDGTTAPAVIVDWLVSHPRLIDWTYGPQFLEDSHPEPRPDERRTVAFPAAQFSGQRLPRHTSIHILMQRPAMEPLVVSAEYEDGVYFGSLPAEVDDLTGYLYSVIPSGLAAEDLPWELAHGGDALLRSARPTITLVPSDLHKMSGVAGSLMAARRTAPRRWLLSLGDESIRLTSGTGPSLPRPAATDEEPWVSANIDNARVEFSLQGELIYYTAEFDPQDPAQILIRYMFGPEAESASRRFTVRRRLFPSIRDTTSVSEVLDDGPEGPVERHLNETAKLGRALGWLRQVSTRLPSTSVSARLLRAELLEILKEFPGSVWDENGDMAAQLGRFVRETRGTTATPEMLQLARQARETGTDALKAVTGSDKELLEQLQLENERLQSDSALLSSLMQRISATTTSEGLSTFEILAAHGSRGVQ